MSNAHCRRCRLLPLVILAFGTLLTAQAYSQPGNRQGAGQSGQAPAGPEIRPGTVGEITTKGRITTLKVADEEGGSYDIKVPGTIDFSVVALGEKDFVKKGLYISARGEMSEDRIFLSKLTLHVAPKSKKFPPGRVQKVEAAIGESVQTYELNGEIVSLGPAKDYPEYTDLVLKIPGRVPPIWMEPGCQVEIASSNPLHAETGQDCQIAVRQLSGKKVAPVGVRIRRSEPFTNDDLFGEKKDD